MFDLTRSVKASSAWVLVVVIGPVMLHRKGRSDAATEKA
jgi:hypothetical protein